LQLTLTPPGNVVVFGLQSGVSGSAFVHSHVTVVVAPNPPPPPPAIRAMTITEPVTRTSPGFRSTRTLRGGELVRFGRDWERDWLARFI
jgi:hypothetical protein